MPKYDYYCPDNAQTVEVVHGVDDVLKYWGEICFVAQYPMGDTPFFAAVRKKLHASYLSIPTGNSELKSVGFTKLVKRDAGVYENVTALDHEARYMVEGQADSRPDLKRKISD